MSIQSNRPTEVINPYRNLVKGGWIGAAICVGLPLILTPYGGDVAMVTWIVGGTLAFGGVLTALISMSMAKKSQRAIDALLAGEALAQWTCSAEEWAAFIEQDRTRGHKSYRFLAWLFGGIIVAIAALGSGFDSFISSLGVLAGLGVGVLTGRLIARSVEREYERRRQSTGAVYIGGQGAIVGGRFHAWEGLGQTIHEAELLPGKPASLHITVETTSTSNGTQSTTYHHVYIPVAAGMEAKAAAVFGIGTANEDAVKEASSLKDASGPDATSEECALPSHLAGPTGTPEGPCDALSACTGSGSTCMHR